MTVRELQVRDSVVGLFIDAVEAYGSHPLFVRPQAPTLSYLQSAQHVVSVAERLLAAGIRSEERVCCFSEDTVELGLFVLACAAIGATAVPVSPVFSPAYLVDGVAKPLGARWVMTPAARASELERAGLKTLWYDDALGEAPHAAEGMVPLPHLPTEAAPGVLAKLKALEVHRETFIIQLTSGTTRRPKLVPRPHRAPLRYARYVGDQLSPRSTHERHRFLFVETFNHAFGLHIFTTALRLGGALCVSTALSSSVRLTQARALRPTVLPILPRVQRSLWRQYVAEGGPTASQPMFDTNAQYVCSAGGPSVVEVLTHLHGQGLKVVEFYGSTEASLIACTPALNWRPGSCGRLVDDVDYRLEPDGELLVRSEGMMTGYLENTEATAQVLTSDGFLRTGDVAEVGPDGFLRVLGRKHDFFGTYEGSAVYPAPIEQQLESYPWSQQVMLVGDGKPYLSAIIVVRPELTGAALGQALLSPLEHAELYALVGKALEKTNATLEKIEQLARFALVSQPFDDEIYALVGPGKVRRNRRLLAQRHQQVIDWLYAEEVVPDNGSFVPGADRRLRQPRRPKNEVT